MNQSQPKHIEWIDPYTKESLLRNNNKLKSSTNEFPINNGIPNFVKYSSLVQDQVTNSFNNKWKNFQIDNILKSKLRQAMLELISLDEKDLQIFENKTVLDVGIGIGTSAQLWANRAKEFHGIDIMPQIYLVKKILKHVILSQADVNALPYTDNSFDVIVSNGVLHHTPSTRLAFKNCIKKLRIGGLILCYIYKKRHQLGNFLMIILDPI